MITIRDLVIIVILAQMFALSWSNIVDRRDIKKIQDRLENIEAAQ